jgi:hypothetical protein
LTAFQNIYQHILAEGKMIPGAGAFITDTNKISVPHLTKTHQIILSPKVNSITVQSIINIPKIIEILPQKDCFTIPSTS